MKKKLICLGAILASTSVLADQGGNEVTFDTTVAAQCGIETVIDTGTIGESFEGDVPPSGDPATANIINNSNPSTGVAATVTYSGDSLTGEDGKPLFKWTVVSGNDAIETGELTADSFNFSVDRIQNVTGISIYVNQVGDDKLQAGIHEVSFSMNVDCGVSAQG
ncbi:hypothetical protein [Vibrio methylphosphonaticus]|uniref:hypothetical protein n=1 Tax=Vibrio methylphosphonaticus TaxID=2946866 RepID=UPI00202A37DA|nr:hypothetical protein [Vibrio methylphosphonaticus]MCL9776776.1 hypothetical protein [Vibrio methylphosphonaticus]